ncbi:MAG: TonB-dependent receptor [Bacteroidales bacterium]|jgi:outer membrane cobalamin receptor|nr:TonB-dependent receptor [Bacteroidales bacterium]
MRVFKQKVFLLIFVVLTVGNGVTGQTVADSLELPEVVISERFRDREMRSTAPRHILIDEQIGQLNALQLSDAVKHFPGVTIRDYGGIGGLKTISVRSLGAHHTAVSYNGIVLSDQQTGQIDIGRFSLDNVERLTLHNGQDDRIFRPARTFAATSALEITTAAPRFADNKRVNGKATLRGGSFGLFNPSLLINSRLSEKVSASINGEWMSSRGDYPYLLRYGSSAGDSTSWERRINGDVENMRLESSLHAKFSASSRGGLRLYYYSSERGLPGATIYHNTLHDAGQRLWDRSFFLQGHFEHALSCKWELQANGKFQQGYLRYLDPTYLGASGKVEDIFTQFERYGSLSALYRAFPNLSFSASSDLISATMHGNRQGFTTPTRLTTHAVIAAKWVSERLLATASLLRTQTFESTENGVAATNCNRLSPYLSASFKPLYAHELRLRAFYKKSFRLPTFNDLYYPQVGVRNLLPEDAEQFNIGLTFGTTNGALLQQFTFMADAYHNRVDNKIVAYPTGNLHQWAMINVGKVIINGADLSMESVTALTDRMMIRAGVSYTWQIASDRTDPQQVNYGHQLPYTPRHSGSARAALELKQLQLSYTLIWSGERYSNGYNDAAYRMQGYADHSISLQRSFSTPLGRLLLAGEALNLTGRNYEIVRNYPMPGRSYRLTLSIHF